MSANINEEAAQEVVPQSNSWPVAVMTRMSEPFFVVKNTFLELVRVDEMESPLGCPRRQRASSDADIQYAKNNESAADYAENDSAADRTRLNSFASTADGQEMISPCAAICSGNVSSLDVARLVPDQSPNCSGPVLNSLQHDSMLPIDSTSAHGQAGGLPSDAPLHWGGTTGHNPQQQPQAVALDTQATQTQGFFAHAYMFGTFALRLQAAAWPRHQGENDQLGADWCNVQQGGGASATMCNGSPMMQPMQVMQPIMNPMMQPVQPGSSMPSEFGLQLPQQVANRKHSKQSQAASSPSPDNNPKQCQNDDIPHTTIMIRHFPEGFSRRNLIELLDAEGFNGSYDFVYFPLSFSTWSSFDYAFVNAVTAEEAHRIWKHFDTFRQPTWPESVECAISWGEPLQGLEPHIERYRNSPVMHKHVPSEFKPAIFRKGNQVKFPAPTKRIRPPRIKRDPVEDAKKETSEANAGDSSAAPQTKSASAALLATRENDSWADIDDTEDESSSSEVSKSVQNSGTSSEVRNARQTERRRCSFNRDSVSSHTGSRTGRNHDVEVASRMMAGRSRQSHDGRQKSPVS